MVEWVLFRSTIGSSQAMVELWAGMECGKNGGKTGERREGKQLGNGQIWQKTTLYTWTIVQLTKHWGENVT